MKAPSRPASFTDIPTLHLLNKGKQREQNNASSPDSLRSVSSSPFKSHRAPRGWWLDVSSPTWDDMRAIGKLLHLHPLTLEDILQQEPREKLELFPKLGYHFIVFKAIQGATQSGIEGDSYLDDGGSINEVNIYLVVFREGICTVSLLQCLDHTERVRNRLRVLRDSFYMTSDWIAHGILDSIVDSFFPFLDEIDKEVTTVEQLVFSIKDTLKPSQNATATTLRRMARTRRLVTSLTRLLATKSQVVSQVRKRFLTVGQSGPGNGSVNNDDIEIAIHMGDVQDHILTLQHSLTHYERMLSQVHPAYLFQLGMSVSKTKSGTDKALLMLTLVSLGVICVQTLYGIFSMNVMVPANTIPGGPYHWFGVVISLAVAIVTGYLSLVRYWWVQAGKVRGRKLS
ncbi:hypothetical protein SERLADRAFT_347594 [Serpula lacrymans var. lacrymans S7.9]|uniref:Magnesium transporter n=1 Tax=Serpula lacrymans var. lacrymans (strain S7.9) TaxID=578457 RepID=F8NRP7_SERL9|nr:uncharacterized protein SERLADRAFT_347594 [Serpula lacrymans var. lacrymans S7.9]EGO26313.1 hypothetical protein SERLADRAFT_347594 [Serpula lacrymans var. lacrymans S7.9]